VIWPPEDSHQIDEGLCNELNISDKAKSLIRRLPCPTGSYSPVYLYGSSQIFNITHDAALRDSRESPSYDQDKDSLADRYILPQDVQLSREDPETPVIILDTRESKYNSRTKIIFLPNLMFVDTIRVVSMIDGADELNPPHISLERPEGPYYYRNYWPRHAPTWLRMQLNRIRALDVIPPGPNQSSYVDFTEEWMVSSILYCLA
jgi:hypothetical protein